MSTKYTIRIDNASGNLQQYAIFSEPPLVDKVITAKVFSNVFATATTPDQAQSTIEIYNEYQATVGTSTGAPADGVTVSVSQRKPVTLGYQDLKGKTVPGTSLNVNAPAPDALAFGTGAPPPAGGLIGCFEMITDTSFTSKNATDFNMVMGMTTRSSKGNGVSAVFIARPNEKFQVQPIVTYYVAAGSYTPGTIINYNNINVSKITIPFSDLNTNTANLKHMQNGALILIE